MISNPILKGFCPDPSIIRAGDDYYIACSTFEWWPGVRLWHSRDLQNWRQIPSPIRRKSMLNLLGDPPSGGVWAPCLSYDGERFYILFTDVKTKKGRFYNTHNYLIYSDEIEGEWSEPIYLNSIGFDPSLFHDRDGRKYLVNMVNGFKGILLQELDPLSFALIGESREIYRGTGIGFSEGPHLYHIGKYYYLLLAEGGTGYEHCVSLARSEQLYGPYEAAPDNPILTSDRKDPAALQRCGHGDLVQTADGEWYMAHLCSRPLADGSWSCLGRETALQKMLLDEDLWFKLKSGGRFAEHETEAAEGLEPVPETGEDAAFFKDDFSRSPLSLRYSSPRAPYEDFSEILPGGGLRLRGRDSLNSLHEVSLLAVRQQSFCCRAETVLRFEAERPEQAAGLAYMYDALNFFLLLKSKSEEGEDELLLLKSDRGEISELAKVCPIPAELPLKLYAELSRDGHEVSFFYAVQKEEEEACRTLVAPPEQTNILSDEYCRGFTGAHFGLYVHDLYNRTAEADFLYFAVSPAEEQGL